MGILLGQGKLLMSPNARTISNQAQSQAYCSVGEDIFQTPTFRVPLLLVIRVPIVVYATKTGESTSFNNYSSNQPTSYVA